VTLERNIVCILADVSLAGDVRDSKSTSGEMLCLIGPKTFVPITWLCMKQGAISHSSSETGVISSEVCLRVEGIPCLLLWEIILEICYSVSGVGALTRNPSTTNNKLKDQDTIDDVLTNVDYVPTIFPISSGRRQIMILEDSDPFKKNTIKGRSPQMRHVPRTHKVHLDRLFE
jgi:hypothetical protein